MTLTKIKNIINYAVTQHTVWQRFDYKQAEYEVIKYRSKWFTLFKSYDTIVGVYDMDDDVFYELGKYSPTTSKQVSQFCSNNLGNPTRVLLDRPKWSNRWVAQNYITPSYYQLIYHRLYKEQGNGNS